MKYFTISNGLRGCYMPDNAAEYAVKTRRELKNIIASEAYYMKEAHGFGGSKRAVASFVAECWREAHKKRPAFLPYCLPFGSKPGNAPFGIFVSVSTRADYLEYENQNA